MTTTNDQNKAPSAAGVTWEIAGDTSRVTFTARQRLFYVMPMTVHGAFTDIAGTLMLDEREPTNSRVFVTIGAASLNTGSTMRDKHLRSADFFDSEHFPTLTFASQRIKALDQAAGRYRVTGTQTMRGIAREVSLDISVSPEQVDHGTPRLTFRGAAELDRRDFGLVWSRSSQQIADGVTIDFRIELTRA